MPRSPSSSNLFLPFFPSKFLNYHTSSPAMFIPRAFGNQYNPTSLNAPPSATIEDHPEVVPKKWVPWVAGIIIGLVATMLLALGIYSIKKLFFVRRRQRRWEKEDVVGKVKRAATLQVSAINAAAIGGTLAPLPPTHMAPKPTWPDSAPLPRGSIDSQKTLHDDAADPCYPTKRFPNKHYVVLDHPEQPGVPPIICTVPTEDASTSPQPGSSYYAPPAVPPAVHSARNLVVPLGPGLYGAAAAPVPPPQWTTYTRQAETPPPAQEEDEAEDVADMYADIPDTPTPPAVVTPALRMYVPRRTHEVLPPVEAPRAPSMVPPIEARVGLSFR